MTVDEPGRHELAASINGAIHVPAEVATDVYQSIVLKDYRTVKNQLVTSAVVADDPTTLNQRAHHSPPRQSFRLRTHASIRWHICRRSSSELEVLRLTDRVRCWFLSL